MTLIYGLPKLGKSRLLLHGLRPGHLYVSTEAEGSDVSAWAQGVGADPDIMVQATSNERAALAALQAEVELVAIDSLDGIATGRRKLGLLSRLVAAHRRAPGRRALLLVSHVNTEGDPAGGPSVAHIVDALVTVSRGKLTAMGRGVAFHETKWDHSDLAPM